jgi:hypothetical protein
VMVRHMTPNQGQLSRAVIRGSYQGQLSRAVPGADRQLMYIESCSSPLPSLSSLLSLVSLISAIYEADYSCISYVPSQRLGVTVS